MIKQDVNILELNKEQVRILLEMEYVHHWMKYSYKDDYKLSDDEKKLTQKIFKLANNAGFTDYVKYEDQSNDYYTTGMFDEDVEPIIAEYEAAQFDDEEDEWSYEYNPKELDEIGRNDICYCGSGKKYKKCCIDKE